MATELDIYKAYKIRLIREHTQDIEDVGYYCYMQDIIIPLSNEDKALYGLLDQYSDQIESWPLYLPTQDIFYYAAFQNASELHQFMINSFKWSLEVRASQGPLILQVLQATTAEQVNAIQDNREWEDFKHEEEE